jgi:hypothetical protein
MLTIIHSNHSNQNSTQDDRGAYLPSPFRIKVECSRIRKYGNGHSFFPWDDQEHIRRMNQSGPELGESVNYTEEPLTIPMITEDSFRNEYGELVA